MKILGNKELRRYFFNTSWMLSEKVFSLGLGLLATVLLARSLGPADFGILNYALSLTALIAVFCHLGLHGLAVKEIKENPAQETEIVSTIFLMKTVSASVGFVLLLLIAWHSQSEPSHILAIVVIGLTLFAKPFETLDHWFQALVLARLAALAHMAGHGIGNGLKIAVALGGLSLIYAASAHVVMLTVTAVLLATLFIWKNRAKMTLGFSSGRAKTLLGKGAWIFLGSITAVIYLKVDQVMLQHMVGASAVGQYAAAAKLSEAWYFIPATLMASVFPKLLEKRRQPRADYHHFLQTLLDGLFFAAAGLTLAVIFFSNLIIQWLYGPEYAQAGTILKIHIVATLFIYMRALFSKWILAEELFKLSLITQGLGAISNLVLNYFFIRSMGAVGAAWATLISYSIASYFSLLILPQSRVIFVMMTKSMFFHWVISLHKLYRFRSL